MSTSVVSFKQARDIAAKYGTPVLACDLSRVRDNYLELKSLFKNIGIYYAVKANPLPEIITTLFKEGSCFDVASKNEIALCLRMGAKPEQLLYANPIKPVEHIKFANEKGIKTFTFDSPGELDKMAKYAPGSDVILRLMVRDVGSSCKLSAKFGAREKNALDLLKKARSLGLNPLGLSFHVGSQCMNMENFGMAIDISARVFNLAKSSGIDLRLLDLGGGIPITYTKNTYPLKDLADFVNQRLASLFSPEVRVIMEPGRPIVGSCMTLLTRVIGISRRGERDCIYIDDGIYGSLSEKVFGHCEYRIVSDRDGPLKKYTVFGPTCDSMDMVTGKTYLPQVEEGDLLLVLNTGAYTNAASTHFNGFDPAEIVFVKDGQPV